jgi:threonine/homoserine/homoserine lactone efflux protein
MEASAFIKGMIIGFSIAAPVGPIGVLCIQRTLAYGRTSGLITGFGAATADGIYGTVAAFGLTIISGFLIGQQFWFKLVGGAFLIYLGVKTFLSHPAEKAAPDNHKGLVSDYFSTVFLALTSPATILCFIAVFAGLGLGSGNKDMFSALLMATGVFVGSASWWLILSGGVSLFRTKFSASSLGVVNNISGVIIAAFGLFALASLLH